MQSSFICDDLWEDEDGSIDGVDSDKDKEDAEDQYASPKDVISSIIEKELLEYGNKPPLQVSR